MTEVTMNKRSDEEERLKINGSVYWMAPEVAMMKERIPVSDIWSVAATVIEMLTGQPPWIEKRFASTTDALLFIGE